MRILFIVPRIHKNLYETYLFIKSMNYDCKFFIDYTSDMDAIINSEDIINYDKLHNHSSSFEKYDIDNFDLIFIKDHFIGSIIKAYKLKKISESNIIIYTQDPLVLDRKSSLKEIIKHTFLRQFTRFQIVSPVYSRESDSRLFAFDSITSIQSRFIFFPFIQNMSINKKAKSYNNRPVEYLMVARYKRFKRIEIVILAVSKIKSDFDFIVTIAGYNEDSKYKRYLEDLIRELNLESKFKLLSNLTFVETQKLYKTSDVFILTSHKDPAPVAVAEALSNGLPCIVSSEVGLSSYIFDGYNGFKFNKKKINQLSKLIQFYAENPVVMIEHSLNATTFAEKVLSPTVVYNAITRLYDKKIGG